MERFAASAGLRFVQEYDLEQLRKWRATWPNKNLSAVKKLGCAVFCASRTVLGGSRESGAQIEIAEDHHPLVPLIRWISA
jgi:hypothetical protein